MKIKLQRIELEQEIKDKLDATIKGKNLEITYYNGYLTKFKLVLMCKLKDSSYTECL